MARSYVFAVIENIYIYSQCDQRGNDLYLFYMNIFVRSFLEWYPIIFSTWWRIPTRQDPANGGGLYSLFYRHNFFSVTRYPHKKKLLTKHTQKADTFEFAN